MEESCPDAELLVELVERRLDAPRRGPLEEHLDACAVCRRAVATLLEASGNHEEPRSERRLLASGEAHREPPSELALAPGDVVDQYRVEALLGAGATALVYRARDRVLGRRVALKVLRQPLHSDGERGAFRTEAQTTARFQHSNIVTVYGAGEIGGHPYLALEYVEGVTLRDRLARGRLGFREVVRIASAIASGLAEAHAEGVIHCDLKPSNVLLGRAGRLLVADFGLARALAEGSPADMGVPAGTPAYMAPEQWIGRSFTPATDIWALGVVLFEALSGRRPFEGRTAREIQRRVLEEGSAPRLPASAAPPKLTTLVDACLRRDPEARPKLSEVQRTLGELAGVGPSDRGVVDAVPFRGLLAFSEAHAHAFFGRDAEIELASERLSVEPRLVVLGASGIGKSSFVRAGLLPRMREKHDLLVVELFPGKEPFSSLARALAAGGIDLDPHTRTPEKLAMLLEEHAERLGKTVVVFVDQFEETFSLARDVDGADAFARAVLGAADSPTGAIRVVVTLREDFVSRLAGSRDGAEPLSGLFALGPLGKKALLDSLTRPVAELGYRWEPKGLAEEMVEALGSDGGAVSLLQFAAERLWHARDEVAKTLGQPAYDEAGGVAGALADYADRVLSEVGPAGEATARHLFLRLLAPDGTRRVLARTELLDGSPPEAGAVLEKLVAARLLSLRGGASEPEIEVAHEALVHGWSRLERWVEGSREERAILADAERAALAWDRRGRTDDLTWTGADLAGAESAALSADAIPALLREFLIAGQNRHRRKRVRRALAWGAGLGLLAIAFVVSLFVSIAFHEQRREAEARTEEALVERQRAHEREADALREAAEALLARGDLRLARAKARASLELADDPRARVLLGRLLTHPLVWSRSVAGPTLSSDRSPDGRTVAAGAGRDIQLLEGDSGEPTSTLSGHRDTVVSVRFSPDGSRIASGAMDGRLLLWTLSGTSSVLVDMEEGIYAVAFSPDGTLLAGGGRGGRLHVFDTRTLQRVSLLRQEPATINAIAFDTEGRLWSAANDGRIREWDVRRATPVRVLGPSDGSNDAPAAGVQSLAFDGVGRLAAGDARGELVIWDLERGAPTLAVRAHRSLLHALAFDPNGTLLSGGHDHRARSWSEDGVLGLDEDEESAVWEIRMGLDRKALVTRGDQSIRLVDRSEVRSDTLESIGHTSFVDAVAFDESSHVVASAGNDKTVRLWDVATGAQLRVLRGHDARVWDVRFSPDGRRLASASEDQSVRIWDPRTATELLRLSADGGPVYSVAFRDDGRVLATVSKDGRVREWDLASGALLGAWVSRDVSGVVRFLPRSSSTMTAGLGGAHVWEHGRLVRTLEAHGGLRGLAVSPAGDVASVSVSGELFVWPAGGGSRRTVGRIEGRLDELAFRTDSSQVLATTASGSIRRFPLAEGATELPRIEAHSSGVSALAVDREGRWLASGGDDGTVRLFREEDAKPLWTAPALAGDASGDGSLVVRKASGDVEIASPEGLVTLPGKGPSDEVSAVALGEGRLVAVGHRSGDVRLFHRRTGFLLSRHVHGPVVGLVFSGEALHATSELGTKIRIDLHWILLERCLLLGELGRRVPFTWTAGGVVRQPAAACLR